MTSEIIVIYLPLTLHVIVLFSYTKCISVQYKL